MLVKPFLKMTDTLRAPQRRAEVQQSKAVSPHPRTITCPKSSGSFALQEHIPTRKHRLLKSYHISLAHVIYAFELNNVIYQWVILSSSVCKLFWTIWEIYFNKVWTQFQSSFSLGASMDLMSTSRVAEQIKVGRGGGEKKCNTVDNLSLKGLLCNQW